MRSRKLGWLGVVAVACMAAVVGCKPTAKTESTAGPSASSSQTSAAPVAVTAADTTANGSSGNPWEIDSETMKAPAGSSLERILKGLHMRVCIRGDVAPFGSFAANGGLDGLEVELATEIVKQISIDYKQPLKIDWTVVAAPDRVKKLQDDACDLLVASLSYTPERAAQVATSKVYLKTDKVLLSAAKVTRKVPVIAKIGGATSAGDSADVPKGTDRVFGTYAEVVYAMDNEEIDYLVTDRPIADQLIRSATKPYTVSKTLAPGAESYVAAVQNGHPELIGAVNKSIDDLARSGRLAHIHRRWL